LNFGILNVINQSFTIHMQLDTLPSNSIEYKRNLLSAYIRESDQYEKIIVARKQELNECYNILKNFKEKCADLEKEIYFMEHGKEKPLPVEKVNPESRTVEKSSHDKNNKKDLLDEEKIKKRYQNEKIIKDLDNLSIGNVNKRGENIAQKKNIAEEKLNPISDDYSSSPQGNKKSSAVNDLDSMLIDVENIRGKNTRRKKKFDDSKNPSVYVPKKPSNDYYAYQQEYNPQDEHQQDDYQQDDYQQDYNLQDEY